MRADVTPVVLVCNDAYWLPYVLESIKGHFDKYVLYDVGSTDGTTEICGEFARQGSNVLFEAMPKVEAKAQLAYRNAMIAEAQTDYYMIVDGDEVWPQDSLEALKNEFPRMKKYGRLYGVCRRIEVREDLRSAYSADDFLPHHRLYHRTATWRGTHPGERPTIMQRNYNEFQFTKDVRVFHFHNALRSPYEAAALKRMIRKSQKTYHRGEVSEIDLLKELPILKDDLGFDPSPDLKQLLNDSV